MPTSAPGISFDGRFPGCIPVFPIRQRHDILLNKFGQRRTSVLCIRFCPFDHILAQVKGKFLFHTVPQVECG